MLDINNFAQPDIIALFNTLKTHCHPERSEGHFTNQCAAKKGGFDFAQPDNKLPFDTIRVDSDQPDIVIHYQKYLFHSKNPIVLNLYSGVFQLFLENEKRLFRNLLVFWIPNHQKSEYDF